MIQTMEVSIAKEVDDVGKFIVELVADIRKGKDKAAIVSENLANLVGAIDGISGVVDEVKENRKVVLATLGMRTGELTDAIIG